MNSYKELEIFKLSKILAVRIHQMTLTLPRFEIYEEGSQIRRSSKSIASAIVEGYGRRKYKAEFYRYLILALCECDETLLHLDFLFETKSLVVEASYLELKKEYIKLSKSINKYISMDRTGICC